jgi:hypothetical protein
MFEAMSGLKINFLKSEIMMILHNDEIFFVANWGIGP